MYNKDPQKLIIDLVTNLELLAEKSKVEMRNKLRAIEVAVNERMKKIIDQLNEREKNIEVTKLSTKTNALKNRKNQICQHISCEIRKIISSV